jgi:hypothetical protein
MRIDLSTSIDRRLEALIVARVRRQWPVLRLIPARWIQPAIEPTAVRLRRSLTRGALALAVPSGVIVMLATYVR